MDKKDQARDRMRRMRARNKPEAERVTKGPNVTRNVTRGKQSPVVPWTGKQAWQDGELVPVRCWHCGDYHASVQLARECTMETALGEMCGRFAGVVDGVWLQV